MRVITIRIEIPDGNLDPDETIPETEMAIMTGVLPLEDLVENADVTVSVTTMDMAG